MKRIPEDERDAWFVPEEAPTPQWAERRRLAEALRRLCLLTVTSEGDEALLREVTEAVEQASENLEAAGTHTFLQDMARDGYRWGTTPWSDRSAFTGRCNPLAPPLSLSKEGERAVGTVQYSESHEGAPGCVHGGHVAAAFDQVCGYIQIERGIPCFTGRLAVDYLKPTRLNRPLRFEAWLDRDEGKLSHVEGRLLDGELLVARAQAVFVGVEIERIITLLTGDNSETP